MALEYSSAPGNERFSPPNPVRLQNKLLIAAGAVFLILGIVLMFVVRGSAAQGNADAFGGILVSVGMIAVGVGALAWAFSHLRFWFGRERPNSLDGATIKELMRQRALEFREPSGPLNGLLYSWIHDLIYSPAPIQHLAQRQFQNGLTMAVLLVSLLLALMAGRPVVGDGAWAGVSQWMGLVYLGFALKLLFSGTGMAHTQSGTAAIGRNALVLLIAFAIIGPVLLSFAGAFLPQLPWSPYPHVFVLLGAALLVYGLFFLAVLKQANTPPQTEVSNEQEAWSFNCQPSLIMGEYDRHMQTNWTSQVPNRRYLRVDPTVDVTRASGNFKGEAMEETQPVPMLKNELTFAEAWADARLKMLLVLDAMGLAFLVLSALFLFWFGMQIGQPDSGIGSLLEGGIFLSLGYFAFHASHALWKRFDFDSRVVWLEMDGSYVSANMEHGNVMHDTIKTRSNVIQIQSMTFRVWVARLSSVTFGVNAPRHIVGLYGEPSYAASLAAHLRQFAQNQAMILAPTSQADIERHSALARLNQQSRSPQIGQQEEQPSVLAIQDDQGETTLLPVEERTEQGSEETTNQTIAVNFCSQCGSNLEPKDMFCTNCGGRLKPA